MKKYLKILLPLCLVATAPATMAADKSFSLSGNVALTTDYVWRGISQSNEEAAIQGGFDFEHKKGFYAGIWGSNVNFLDGDQAQVEIDLYGGFKFKIGNFELDAGVIHYDYPGALGTLMYDFEEVYIGASFATKKAGTFSAKYSNAPDYFGTKDSANYLEFGYEYGFKNGFTVSAHVGKSDGDAFETAGAPDTDYTDTKIAVSKDFAGFGFELAATDTNYSKAECGGSKICDSRIVLTVSKSL